MGQRLLSDPHPPRLVLAAVLLLASASAQARTGDTLQPYLFYNLTQDNNLFRVPVNEQSDTYHQLGAGVLLDWNQNRQEIVGRLSANKTTFSKNTILNYSGYELLGQWNWQLGNHLSGQLGYTNSRSLASFADFGNVNAQNTVDHSTKNFNLGYLLHPRWRLNAVLDTETHNYSATTLNYNDRTVDHAEIGTDYLTPKGSRLGVYAGRWNGSYPHKQTVCISIFFCGKVDNSYNQDEIGLRATWALDSKVQLNGRVGQTRRQYNEFTQRDFSGLTGRLDANWLATGKLAVNGAFYRDIGAILDIFASNAVNDGVRINPTWLINQKLKLSAELYRENRNYEGDPFSLGIHRKDREDGYSLSLSFQPRDWANLSLSFRGQNRKSSLSGFDFSDQSVNLTAQFVF